MMKDLKSLRMSQGLTTFGIGAIVGIGDESFINTGVTHPEDQNKIIFPRLERRLGVYSLRYPKVKYQWTNQGQLNIGNKFSFMRFPSWMFCPSCGMMKHITPSISRDLNGKAPLCENNSCKGVSKTKLQPARFVVACEHGHMGEFPWKYWAHSERNVAEHGNCQKNTLFFEARSGVGAGWESLVVRCACGARRSMQAFNDNREALQSIGQKCSGKQPWQPATEQECGETPRVSQKNASNLYQPVIVSAIDIETPIKAPAAGHNEANIVAHTVYKRLVARFEDTDGDLEDANVRFSIQIIIEDTGCTQEEILSLLKPNDHNNDKELVDDNRPTSIFELNQSLQEDEYPIFFSNVNSRKFVNTIEKIDTHIDDPNAQLLASLVENVSLVKRLREVRAFKGFNRLQFDPGKIIPPSLDLKPTWLPAIEVFGEGIFISINIKKLDSWYRTNKSAIDGKMDPVMMRYLSKNNDDRFGPFSSKFVLLHTLSHILIRQLSFESGYNSASLRESIYFSDEQNKEMAGILIYTADSDSEGSLGGLVRQGQWERLLPTTILSLQNASWCSSDPVCRESKGQGQDGLNQGACHACGLISETSCTHLNSLLSRTLLIDKEIGFFKDIV